MNPEGNSDALQAEQRFQEIVARFLVDAAVTSGTGFGSSAGLRFEGKIFAMLVRGELVVKLRKTRVDELVEAGTGTRLESGRGRQMKEWASVPLETESDWDRLAAEALEFARSSGRKP